MSIDELRICATRALIAWDGTVLPKAHDGLLQDRMEDLRAVIEAQPQSGPGRPMTMRECMEAEEGQPQPEPPRAEPVPVPNSVPLDELVRRYEADPARAAMLKPKAEPAPDGWKLVPVEPTPEMADMAKHWHAEGWDWPKALYRAMLSASPIHPAQPQPKPPKAEPVAPAPLVWATPDEIQRMRQFKYYQHDLPLYEHPAPTEPERRAEPICPGRPDSRCHYDAKCGSVCNKCGHVHDGYANKDGITSRGHQESERRAEPLTDDEIDDAIRKELGAWMEDDEDLVLYRQISRAVLAAAEKKGKA